MDVEGRCGLVGGRGFALSGLRARFEIEWRRFGATAQFQNTHRATLFNQLFILACEGLRLTRRVLDYGGQVPRLAREPWTLDVELPSLTVQPQSFTREW